MTVDRAITPLDDIMQRYSQGDITAFNALYDALAPRLYRFCLRLTRRRSEADDLFQDALLRLHRARASYTPGAPPLPWIYAIARSAYLDRLRWRRRRPESTEVPDEQISAVDEMSPESESHARTLHGVVERALAGLSEKNRSAYILLREEELGVAEAAAILGITGDAVKQRAHRACEQIKAALRAAEWKDRSQ